METIPYYNVAEPINEDSLEFLCSFVMITSRVLNVYLADVDYKGI